MYTEEYEKKNHYIVKILITVVIIFILIFISVQYIKPILVKKNNNNMVHKNTNRKQTDSLIENINQMKDAATSYYSKENIPISNGDFKKMSLREMIKRKIITELKDQNNKVINKDKSYVKIIKKDDTYLLKINVKDSTHEKSKVFNLGCYLECINDTERDNIDEEENVIRSSINNTQEYINSNEKTICEYKKGYYYNSNGEIVSELEYIKSCNNPTCTKIQGYYFGINGNSITKSQYDKECNNIDYSCKQINTHYYDINGNEVSELNYLKSCKRPICTIIDGYYFGINGNSITKTKYQEECKSSDENK